MSQLCLAFTIFLMLSVAHAGHFESSLSTGITPDSAIDTPTSETELQQTASECTNAFLILEQFHDQADEYGYRLPPDAEIDACNCENNDLDKRWCTASLVADNSFCDIKFEIDVDVDDEEIVLPSYRLQKQLMNCSTKLKGGPNATKNSELIKVEDHAEGIIDEDGLTRDIEEEEIKERGVTVKIDCAKDSKISDLFINKAEGMDIFLPTGTKIDGCQRSTDNNTTVYTAELKLEDKVCGAALKLVSNSDHQFASSDAQRQFKEDMEKCKSVLIRDDCPGVKSGFKLFVKMFNEINNDESHEVEFKGCNTESFGEEGVSIMQVGAQSWTCDVVIRGQTDEQGLIVTKEQIDDFRASVQACHTKMKTEAGRKTSILKKQASNKIKKKLTFSDTIEDSKVSIEETVDEKIKTADLAEFSHLFKGRRPVITSKFTNSPTKNIVVDKNKNSDLASAIISELVRRQILTEDILSHKGVTLTTVAANKKVKGERFVLEVAWLEGECQLQVWQRSEKGPYVVFHEKADNRFSGYFVQNFEDNQFTKQNCVNLFATEWSRRMLNM